MENRYDDEDFFHEYAKMPRSRDGLSSAGEWSQLEKLFPPLEGKAVLDLGCGYGWHCKCASDRGASRVLGIDSSLRMLFEAQKRNQAENIEYRLCPIEDYEYPESTWDVVISNLALHYIEDIEDIYGKVFKTLKSDGVFIMNIEHPSFTAGVGQDWARSEDGSILHWPLDNYFLPGERTTRFLGKKVVKFHHTLTQVLMGLIDSGFALKAVEEAMPPEEMLSIPGMSDELRRPMMLLVKAAKPS